MRRIELSQQEKVALRMLYNGCDCSNRFGERSFAAAVSSLECKGLARGAWASSHELVGATIADEGVTYVGNNPRLSDPTDWAKVAAIAACAAAVAAVIALFVACGKL